MLDADTCTPKSRTSGKALALVPGQYLPSIAACAKQLVAIELDKKMNAEATHDTKFVAPFPNNWMFHIVTGIFVPILERCVCFTIKFSNSANILQDLDVYHGTIDIYVDNFQCIDNPIQYT